MALRRYEDNICPGCGQQMHEAMDPDLVDEWSYFDPVRCGACTALSRAADKTKDWEHPQALRYTLGLHSGWQERKASAVARREAAAAGEPKH